MKVINIENERFGKLVALSREGTQNNNAIWKCKCDCGNTKLVRLDHLRHGSTCSCGCLPPHTQKPSGRSNFERLYRVYVKGAVKRNYTFDLSKIQFEALVQANCWYCGVEPIQVMLNSHSNGAYIYNGIDRIDNTIGYTIENCVTCCKVCNRAKREMSYDEFMAYLRRIADKHGRR